MSQVTHSDARTRRETAEPADREVEIQQLVVDVGALTTQATRDPGQLTPSAVLQLQRMVGNRTVSEMLAPDRQQAATSKRHAVQRQEDEEEIQTQPLVQRQVDEEEIQTRPASGATIQRKDLTTQQEAQYSAIGAAITGNNEWAGSPAPLTEVLAELKKLVADDTSLLAELTEVFVTQAAKLVYDEEKEGTGEYEYKSNEMKIGPQSAIGMADTIVFESGNARRRRSFQSADEMLRQKEAGALGKAGRTKAEIEAGTTMDYFDHILKMIETGRTFGQLPPGAKRQFKYFMERYPDYFNMDAKRKAEFREAYKKEMATSPHEARAAAGTRMHLSSQDLYAYERVVQTLAISGVLTLIKGYVEKKKGITLPPHYWNGGKYMSDIGRKPPMIKTAGDTVPDESRGKFYMVAVERAEHYYKVDLGDIKFNAAQAQVAENEHRTTGWNPANAFVPPGEVWAALPDAYTW